MISGFATLEGTEKFAKNSNQSIKFQKNSIISLYQMLELEPILEILMKRQMRQ